MEYNIPTAGDTKWYKLKEYVWTARKATDTITIFEWVEKPLIYDLSNYDSSYGYCG
jgi:hypothetical protein